jgi:histidinol-phosphate aminotransferase
MKDIQRFLRNGIAELKPYLPAKPIEEVQAELGLAEIANMALNENPLGPSPRALEAMEKELKRVNLYPEGPCTFLRREMSKRLGIDDTMITFSNGADNCILMVASAFINEGDEVVMADPTFFVYRTAATIMGGYPVCVKLKDHVHDLDAMRKAVTQRTKLIFLCNPNNPTGTIVTKDALDDWISRLPEDLILVLDEAYFEFVSDRDYPDGLDYIKKGANVICLRTFSKLYGIAGLRVGYALGSSAFVAALNRVREPFPVSRIAQVAALAALEDEEFKQKVLRSNAEGRDYLSLEFEKMALPYAPSHTNFVFVDFGRDSQEVYQSLLGQGIIIRTGHIWNCPTFARITIGTMEENRRFIKALKTVLGTTRNEVG